MYYIYRTELTENNLYVGVFFIFTVRKKKGLDSEMISSLVVDEI
jgi:hypothetical protein